MTKTLRYLKPYGGTVAAGLILKFIGSVAELFLPLLLKTVIDDVADNPAGLCFCARFWRCSATSLRTGLQSSPRGI